jgi:lysophospholipase L1-like esterase
MRLVFLGDSLTWGGYGGDFVAEIADRLPEHEIINAGVGGDTVVNLLRRVDDVLERHEPDAMFVMVGGNDSTSWSMPQTRGYYKKSKNIDDGYVSPDEFEQAYRDLLQRIQLAFVQPLIGIAPTEYSRDLVEARKPYHERVHQLAETMNIPVLDLAAELTPENPIERPPVSLGFIRQIGKHHESGWNDFESERQKWGYTYTFDGMHLMPEAADTFADYMVPFLREHLSLHNQTTA